MLISLSSLKDGGDIYGPYHTPPSPPRPRPCRRLCASVPAAVKPSGAAFHNYRTITTLEAIGATFTLQIRRCLNPACPQVRKPYRPEAEGRLALPKHEFGLDVLTFIGTQRYAHQLSVFPLSIRRWSSVVWLSRPGRSPICWSAINEFVALSLQDTARLRRPTQPQGRGHPRPRWAPT